MATVISICSHCEMPSFVEHQAGRWVSLCCERQVPSPPPATVRLFEQTSFWTLREGQPVRCSAEEWQEQAGRLVARDLPTKGTVVSTIFVGLGRGVRCPTLFETMVVSVDLPGFSGQCLRRNTRAEAIAAHLELLTAVKVAGKRGPQGG